MNTFGKIIEYEKFKQVTYYSVLMDDNKLCEMDKFIEKFSENENYIEDFNILITIIEQMGERKKAHQKWFRPENQAHALPPPSHQMKQFIVDEISKNELRLYCIWLSPEVVILLNGGVKDAQTVQECTTDLYSKFLFAQKVGKAITEKLSYPDHELQINRKELKGDFELFL